MPDWRVSLQGHHEGYISWEEFLTIRSAWRRNRTNGEETGLGGPGARRHWHCSRGVLLCGHCGPPADGTLHGQRRHLSPLSMQLVTPGKSGDEQRNAEPALAIYSMPPSRRSAEGLCNRRTRARLGGAGGVGVGAIRPSGVSADADRTRRVRSGAPPSDAIWRSIPRNAWWRAGWSGAGTMPCLHLEDLKKASRRVSAARSPRGHPRAEAKVLALARIYAGVACPRPPRPRTASGCCAAPQRILRSRSPPLAGRGLDLTSRCNSHIADRVRLSCRPVRQSPGAGARLIRCRNRAQLNREGHASAKGKPYTHRLCGGSVGAISSSGDAPEAGGADPCNRWPNTLESTLT